MKIKILGANGLHASEIRAVTKMEAFRDSWYAYAGVLVVDDQGSMDIDVLIITHDRLLLVELKEWNGDLEDIGGQWYINGSSRGKSPYATKRVHAIRLGKLLEKELKHKLGYSLFVEAHVVLCGNSTPEKISNKEKRFVHTLDDFLKISSSVYDEIVGHSDVPKHLFETLRKPRPNSKEYLPILQGFFDSPKVRPKQFKIHNFIAEETPWFTHRSQLYKEFKGFHEDAAHELALMRRWDFSQLGTGFATQNQWADIALRESRILGYARDRNNRLDEYLLRSKMSLGKDDITEDVTEIYEIRRTYTRLDDFINGQINQSDTESRLDLVRALLVPFSELHSIGIGHRDVDGHNLWYASEQASIVVSGFATAFFPERGTIRDLREQLQSSNLKLPEDAYKTEGEILDAFRQDVFMLATIAYRICFKEQTLKKDDDGILVWKEPNPDDFQGRLNSWFIKALSFEPKDRFANASEMLSQFNDTTGLASNLSDDFSAFDAVMEGDFVKRNWGIINLFMKYPPAPGENPSVGGETSKYRTFADESEAYVKIWQQVKSQQNRAGENRRILRFRQRIEHIAKSNIPTPQIIDYGLLESGGLYLITRIEPGQLWKEAISEIEDSEHRLQVAISLVTTLIDLHEQGLTHGDIHPDNILVKTTTDVESDNNEVKLPVVILLDMLDFGEQTEPFNLEYGPSNPAAADAEERDRFAAYKMIKELIEGDDFPVITEEINRGFKSPNGIPVALSPLQEALKAALASKSTEKTAPEQPSIYFIWNDYSFPSSDFELEHDGAFYHCNTVWDRRNTELLHCYLTSVNSSLSITFDPEQRQIRDVRFKPNIPLSEVVQASKKSQEQLSCKIVIKQGFPNPSSTRAVLNFLLSLDSVLTLLEEKFTSIEDATTEDGLETEYVSVRDIWRTLAETEKETLLTVEIGDTEIQENFNGHLLIPYINNSGRTFDFEIDDIVLVKEEGEDNSLGNLDVYQTNADFLFLNPKRAKLQNHLKKGNILQLESVRNKASRDRRHKALERVLDNAASIPKLMDYFDIKIAPDLVQLEDEPDDQIISRYNSNGKKLNPKQEEAFRQLTAWGPLGVLQGPPGTGKTAFISIFIHYLFHDLGARNILLVGQSHTSVDNVAKKVREVCKDHKTELSVVRIGQENMIATELLDTHTRALQRRMRHQFHREYDQRICTFSRSLVLPDSFVREVAAVHRNISPLLDTLRKCAEGITEITSRPVQSEKDQDRLADLINEQEKQENAFQSFVNSRFPIDANRLINSEKRWETIVQIIADSHEINNPSATTKLSNLLKLSHEWLDVLKTGEANYDQFLVKTRQLVCGTLVGLGQKQLGIAETDFDWVIVDEAARAQASELMIAIQSGRRVLLVGDHRQLPPLYDKNHLKSVAKRLGISQKSIIKTDFQRLFETTKGITLDTQYRMCEPIGDLVSHCFYANELTKLKTGRGSSPDWYSAMPHPWNTPVVWIDSGQGECATGEEPNRNGKGKGYVNHHEINIILDYLCLLSQSPHLEHIRESHTESQKYVIGIITMYRAQLDLLEQKLSQAEWAGPLRNLIKIDTVDSYQGQENPIIILSLVRDSIDKQQGFLVDEPRINVSLSRAQERLIIIGACRMWQNMNSDDPLARVFKFVKEQAIAKESDYKIVGADSLNGGRNG
ncbi:AAA domain-containing protein [Methylomicrobium lacus]|uniref:AAA domain-containing protein n=1 Tax=Methylomicrobium lacus TaxID=136992 RepID=UPI00045E6425|nr:AAA domain-containing protein [Methylomicrobium lacus]